MKITGWCKWDSNHSMSGLEDDFESFFVLFDFGSNFFFQKQT